MLAHIMFANAFNTYAKFSWKKQFYMHRHATHTLIRRTWRCTYAYVHIHTYVYMYVNLHMSVCKSFSTNSKH